MTRKDEKTKEQEALLVLLMLMVFPPKIIIIISTKNRKIARRKVSFCCYLAFHFPFFRVCAGATATTAAISVAHDIPTTSSILFFNTMMCLRPIFSAKASQGSVFSNYSYYEHFFFIHFVFYFRLWKFSHNFQRKTMQIGSSFIMSKLKVSVREDNNSQHQQQYQQQQKKNPKKFQEKYPHNYVLQIRNAKLYFFNLQMWAQVKHTFQITDLTRNLLFFSASVIFIFRCSYYFLSFSNYENISVLHFSSFRWGFRVFLFGWGF